MDKNLKIELHSPPSPLSALSPYCRDFHEWPQSWMGDDRDLVPGQRIVGCFTPFLIHLSQSGLSKKTIRTHIDNLWILGGEIIRDLQEQPKLRTIPMRQLIDTLLETDGPLIYHCESEQQLQNSFESTCRKFRRFLLL